MPPIRMCAEAHCGSQHTEIAQECKRLGLGAGQFVVIKDPQGRCRCACSCLLFGTPVQSGDGEFKAIEAYTVGEQVMAAGTCLDWSPRPIVFSAGTMGTSLQKFAVLLRYKDTAIVVTSDHLFLLNDGTLRRADRLTPDDKLVSPQGEPVSIEAIHIGDYYGGFHHIATSKEPPPPDFAGHLLNTNGVVSADYAAQLYSQNNATQTIIAREDDSLPIVGSSGYVERYGRSSLEAPVLPVSGLKCAPQVLERQQELQKKINIFVPAVHSLVQIPAQASSFLTPEQAAARACEPMRKFNDMYSLEWSSYLFNLYRGFFPDITYHLDLFDGAVNAFSWKEKSARHVALKGGLIRHSALEMAGIALVLARAIAYHYCDLSTPQQNDVSYQTLTDYNAVALVMQKAWYGDQFITMTEAALKEICLFFGVSETTSPLNDFPLCKLSAEQRQIATYQAALNLDPIPVFMS